MALSTRAPASTGRCLLPGRFPSPVRRTSTRSLRRGWPLPEPWIATCNGVLDADAGAAVVVDPDGGGDSLGESAVAAVHDPVVAAGLGADEA